tara:strand:- start:2339 stop:3664 length:1326 start_codon:yes stop_codon:yes gene_type:complete
MTKRNIAEAYRFRNSDDLVYNKKTTAFLLSEEYNKYTFTYTYQDVAHFNDIYKKYENYYPFDNTTPKESGFIGLEDLNSNDLKDAWNFADRAYDATPSVFSVLVEKNNTQVVVDELDDVIYISFRGTETERLDGIRDILSDTDNKVVLASSLGWLGINSKEDDIMLHKGFADYVDVVYDELFENHIKKNNIKKFIITGHSLGGIASQIFAYRLFLDMRFRNEDINIDKVIAFGAPKGMYSPYNMIDNYLNIFNVAYEKDPFTAVFPLYGNALGTQIIFKEDNTYRIFYRDQLTPYLAINLGNSNVYFDELKRNASYTNTYFYGWLRNLGNSLFAYADGQYTRALMGLSFEDVWVFVENVSYHREYNIAIDTLDDNLMILEKNQDLIDNDIREIQQPVNHPSYNTRLFEEQNETFRKSKTPPKILGFVSNYSSLMNNQIIFF